MQLNLVIMFQLWEYRPINMIELVEIQLINQSNEYEYFILW